MRLSIMRCPPHVRVGALDKGVPMRVRPNLNRTLFKHIGLSVRF